MSECFTLSTFQAQFLSTLWGISPLLYWFGNYCPWAQGNVSETVAKTSCATWKTSPKRFGCELKLPNLDLTWIFGKENMGLLCSFLLTVYFWVFISFWFCKKTHHGCRKPQNARLGCGELCDSFDSLRADFPGISGAGLLQRIGNHPLKNHPFF